MPLENSGQSIRLFQKYSFPNIFFSKAIQSKAIETAVAAKPVNLDASLPISQGLQMLSLGLISFG
ncbi:hypothetical protein [Moorena producens]|uniref:hypothetical protein n=1 Tax=Moorena producens TaxID=1155739 RepID=UPI003C7396E5